MQTSADSCSMENPRIKNLHFEGKGYQRESISLFNSAKHQREAWSCSITFQSSNEKIIILINSLHKFTKRIYIRIEQTKKIISRKLSKADFYNSNATPFNSAQLHIIPARRLYPGGANPAAKDHGMLLCISGIRTR